MEKQPLALGSFLGVILFSQIEQQGRTDSSVCIAGVNVLPHVLSTTARMSRHVQGNAPCCVSIHGVWRGCQHRQHGVSMARLKAQPATLGRFGRGCWQRRMGQSRTGDPAAESPLTGCMSTGRPSPPSIRFPLANPPGNAAWGAPAAKGAWPSACPNKC